MEDKDLNNIVRLRSWLQSQDLLAGLALLAIGGFALYESADLTFGSLSKFGPGLLPRVLGIGVVLSGVLILIISLFVPGDRVTDFRLRGPIFVSAALAAFAITIKPLGLVVAAPLTILIASVADTQIRWREAALLAGALAGASILVFGYLLNLSIPMFPSLQAIASLVPASR